MSELSDGKARTDHPYSWRPYLEINRNTSKEILR